MLGFLASCLLCLVSLSPVVSLRILVMNPTFAASHCQFLGRIADSLVDAGHTVHMIVTEMDSSVSDFGSKKAQKIVYIPSPERNAMNDMEIRKDPFKKFDFFDGQLMQNMTRMYQQFTAATIAGYDIWSELRTDEGYDVGISEITAFHSFAVMRILGVRTPVFASAITLMPPFAAFFGIPAPPSYVPNAFMESLSLAAPSFTYPQRVFSLLTSVAGTQMLLKMAAEEEEMFRAHFSGLPPFADLVKQCALLLINTHALLEFPRPTSARVLHIGGFELETEQSSQSAAALLERMDKRLLEALESSPGGVVLVSFGSFTQISKLADEVFDALVRSFAHFPEYTFVWKFDGTKEQKERTEKYDNILTMKWLPQKAILNHPRTRLFLSHMGVNSYTEGAFAGVPFVALPLFADQPYNAAQAVRKGIAVLLSKYDLTEATITRTIDNALHNTTLQEAALSLSAQLRKFPDRGVDRLVRYIEFVAEFGRLPSLDIPSPSFFTYYSLDVILPFLLILLITLAISLRLLFNCCRHLIRGETGDVDIQSKGKSKVPEGDASSAESSPLLRGHQHCHLHGHSHSQH